MATTTEPPVRRAVFNLPNQLTIARLVLSVVLFVLLAFERYVAGLTVFAVAAGTDWLDGFLARKYNLITTLGRILDPFADKIVICGTFIYLVSVRDDARLYEAHLRAWVVVVVVGRELLITALRSFLEQQGSDFSASMSAKLKMVAQCATAVLALLYLTYAEAAGAPSWLAPALLAAVVATVVLTLYSGLGYVFAAIRLVRK